MYALWAGCSWPTESRRKKKTKLIIITQQKHVRMHLSELDNISTAGPRPVHKNGGPAQDIIISWAGPGWAVNILKSGGPGRVGPRPVLQTFDGPGRAEAHQIKI